MPALLELRDVSKTFRTAGRTVTALQGVSLAVSPGETLALVGESGGGKTTLARIALGLLAPDAGEVMRVPGPRPQAIFQDPATSLDPRWRAGEIVVEALRLAPPGERRLTRAERAGRADALLESVGLDALWARRYPHEFSGGQRQRLAIARAIAPHPPFIVADEPLAALDVVTAAQVLALLRRLQRELGIAYLFITHHLGWAARIADRIAVLRQGRIVESGPALQVLTQPQERYTEQLLAATPALATATN